MRMSPGAWAGHSSSSRYELGERRLDVFEFIDVPETLGLDGIAEIRKLVSSEAPGSLNL
ncbi:MAG: hypothetical protein JWL96_4551 [Sphingomonas bacterium]|uniref:hypothetical protein n=1 Tax=Sphingomonas bacterium TaxID=1895847 RepID=UPI00261B748C|nr:hypothetical protein [Sphingomonas bacterium]MDB5712481.1 hypothetical protein [Sphingomonas bacterium]